MSSTYRICVVIIMNKLSEMALLLESATVAKGVVESDIDPFRKSCANG